MKHRLNDTSWCHHCLILVIVAVYAFQTAAQQQDPNTINGGSLLAMAGKECVAVAVDKRFGSGPQVRIEDAAIVCVCPKI